MKFLHLSGGVLHYSPDKAAENLKVSNFWMDQVERKRQMFQFCLQGLSFLVVVKSCMILCDLMDCSLPDSSVLGVFQARILEWIAISFSRGSSRPRYQTHVSCTGRRILYHWANWEAPSFPLTKHIFIPHLFYWKYNFYFSCILKCFPYYF